MTAIQTQRSGYQSSSKLSPTSLAGVIIVHVGLGAAILNMTAITQIIKEPDVIWARNIPADPPKTEPVTPAEPVVKAPTVTTPVPVVDTLPKAPDLAFVKPELPPLAGLPGAGTIVDPARPADPPVPVLVEAKPDRRYMEGFQPPYPAAMLRAQIEGNVTVRVLIGADGRVQDVLLVSAIDPSFFEATKKQALSRWRFTPATRDGVAVASERVMTVRFRLTD